MDITARHGGLIEFHGRDAELLADGAGGRLGDVVVQRYHGLFAIRLILILRMAAFLSACGEALVVAQKTEELLFLHAFTAMRRRVKGRPE